MPAGASGITAGQLAWSTTPYRAASSATSVTMRSCAADCSSAVGTCPSEEPSTASGVDHPVAALSSATRTADGSAPAATGTAGSGPAGFGWACRCASASARDIASVPTPMLAASSASFWAYVATSPIRLANSSLPSPVQWAASPVRSRRSRVARVAAVAPARRQASA